MILGRNRTQRTKGRPKRSLVSSGKKKEKKRKKTRKSKEMTERIRCRSKEGSYQQEKKEK